MPVIHRLLILTNLRAVDMLLPSKPASPAASGGSCSSKASSEMAGEFKIGKVLGFHVSPHNRVVVESLLRSVIKFCTIDGGGFWC